MYLFAPDGHPYPPGGEPPEDPEERRTRHRFEALTPDQKRIEMIENGVDGTGLRTGTSTDLDEAVRNAYYKALKMGLTKQDALLIADFAAQNWHERFIASHSWRENPGPTEKQKKVRSIVRSVISGTALGLIIFSSVALLDHTGNSRQGHSAPTSTSATQVPGEKIVPSAYPIVTRRQLR